MIQNMIGEKTEEDVMRARTYISAERFDRSKSQPRGGTSAADDAPMSDASGSGHGPSGTPRKGRGRGGK